MKMASLWMPLAIACGGCGGGTLDPIVGALPASADGADAGAPPSSTPAPDGGPSTPVSPSPAVFTPSTDCKGKEHFPDDIVLACNLAPNIAVLGATPEHVVVMTSPDSSWKIYRIDRTTAKIEEIAKASGTTTGLDRFSFSPSAKTVTYADGVDAGDGFTIGLYELNIEAGRSALLLDYGVSTAMLSTATHAYYVGDNQNSGFRRVARTGGAPSLVARTSGNPVRIRDGMLYFTQGSGALGSLKRVPEAGGAIEDVADNVPIPRHHLAIDDDGVVFFLSTDATWGWRVVRADGASRTDVFDCADGELCTAPDAILVDGARVYVQQGGQLVAFPKAGVPGPQTQGSGLTEFMRYTGSSVGRPWLEADRVIVASTQGGVDTPSEGVVVARKLDP